MKIPVFISLLVILYIPYMASAQVNSETIKISRTGCLQQGIEFNTQEEIDNFPLNYPGCNHILGNVYINGEDITNLESLIQLNRIEGDLHIFASPESLSGLDSIQYLGSLMFTWNENFSLQGLNNLDTINTFLGFYASDISSLSGLSNLKYIGEDLSIEWSNQLTTLTGLENLTYIGGRLNLHSNQDLSNLDALENVQNTIAEIGITGHDYLTSISGINNLNLSNLEDLTIAGNNSLSVCNEPVICQFLANPTCPVAIYNNAEGCNNPAQVASNCGFQLDCLPYGNYYVMSQSDADNFMTDYPGCTQINGSLTISGDYLTSLQGLLGIRSISQSLSIGPTEQLTNLTGLDSLRIVNGGVQIGWWEGSYNSALISLQGLDNLEKIGLSLEVMNNQSLQNLDGLSSLKSAGHTYFVDNESLISFNGLSSLDSIRGMMQVSTNGNGDYAGLENLKYVAGGLYITYNDSLTSLNGLDSVQPGFLKIANNPLLTDCDTKAVCEYLAQAGSIATINNNAAGCNDRSEVEEACLVNTGDVKTLDDLSLYPNPADEFISLNLPADEKSAVLEIINMSGKTVYTCEVKQTEQHVDVHTLPAGVYLVKVLVFEGVKTEKLIVR